MMNNQKHQFCYLIDCIRILEEGIISLEEALHSNIEQSDFQNASDNLINLAANSFFSENEIEKLLSDDGDEELEADFESIITAILDFITEYEFGDIDGPDKYLSITYLDDGMCASFPLKNSEDLYEVCDNFKHRFERFGEKIEVHIGEVN